MKKVSVMEPNVAIPPKAHHGILDNFISQNSTHGPGSRRGSLAQLSISEDMVLETPQMGFGSRRGSMIPFLENPPPGAGSRRGSLADIIPDWPTLKSFTIEKPSKVILRSATN